MGCAGSKEDGDEGGGGEQGGKDGGKNGTGQGAAGGGAAAVADPRVPMTVRQRFSMVASWKGKNPPKTDTFSKITSFFSWKGIHRALEPTGIAMFVKLFEDNGELLELFEKFKMLKTKEDQMGSEELGEHATMVMTTLDEAIQDLDNPDEFVQYLENVGASHKRIPGFKKEFFWKIEKPFLDSVKETLGDRYTDNMETIYKIAIGIIIQTLANGYDKAS